ncbi:hypothetical protein CYMTET_6810 [Cymbomonas tetramitiformis]|uniref:Capsule synthesis protein CapA domain-containing protein n=1 Tax=Cymbomonas tetramitiformis TaxID=36881 RepID=A0AAE0GWC5_9CHLO|nr:hypothetical protein CYMTET_6810 [Cymbomonas tetramitiformis]
MWQDPSILKLLQSPQVTFANLEGTAASGVNAQGRNVPDPGLVYGVGDVYESEDNLYQFNYNPVVAAELKNSGIDIVSTANNHALDRSSLGVERTLDALDSAGILHIGTRRSGSQPFEGSWYTLLQSHGWNVAWVACTDNSHSATDSFSDPDRQVFSCSDSAFIPVVKDLSGRSDVDAVIVSVHWGGIVPERAAGHNGLRRGSATRLEPDCGMKNFSRTLLNEGATVVLGTHPHVLQTWEKFKAVDGRTGLILYSLGSFMSQRGFNGSAGDPDYKGDVYLSEDLLSRMRSSAFVLFGLSKKTPYGKAEFDCLSYVPLYRKASNSSGRTLYTVDTSPPSQADEYMVQQIMGGALAQTSAAELSCVPIEKLQTLVSEPCSTDPTECVCHSQDPATGCRWCLHVQNARCLNGTGTSTNKLLGTKLPWDTCLALVDSNGDCGEEFYGGGEGGECGCIPRGGHCALGDSIVDAAVYKRYCPPESLHQQHKFDWTWKTILGVVAAGLILCMALGRIRKRLRGVIKARLGLSIEEDVYEQLDGQHAAAMEAQVHKGEPRTPASLAWDTVQLLMLCSCHAAG